MQMLVTADEALQRCWAATDKLFAGIPDWDVQPIDVRHPFGFYFGHMASFAKLKMLPEVRGFEGVTDRIQLFNWPFLRPRGRAVKLKVLQQVRYSEGVQAGTLALRSMV